jgi:hypothetical protein
MTTPIPPSFSTHAERYEGRILIATCNSRSKKWKNIFFLIPAMIVAVINRIVHHGSTQKTIAEELPRAQPSRP